MKTELIKEKIREYEETQKDVVKLTALVSKLVTGGNVESFTISVYGNNGEGDVVNVSSKGVSGSLNVFCNDLLRLKNIAADRLLGEIRELANEGKGGADKNEEGHEVEIEGDE